MAKLKIDLKPSLKRLEIVTKTLVSSKLIGSYKSVFKGKGLEFDDYREYTLDDDASLIDWKATVRSNETLVKEYVEERNLNVFFMIDVSSSMLLGTTTMLKMEYAAEMAASLGYAILQADDSLGFAMFTDKIIKKLPPAIGKRQYYILSLALLNLDNYGGNYDLVSALKFTFSYLPPRSMVIILSDFIGLKGEWKKYIKLFSTRYDLVGIMIRDPIDKALPEYNGHIILEDPYSQDQYIIKPSAVNPAYKSHVAKQEKEIKDAFLQSNADFLDIVTNKPYVKPLIDLFSSRSMRFR